MNKYTQAMGTFLLGLLIVGTASSVYATDIDADGILDIDDNCLYQSNVNQIDTDNDGWGNRCDSDYDNNGVVNYQDFVLLIDGFGGANEHLDINSDGVVNFYEFAIFRNHFLLAPGPAGYARWIAPGNGNWDDAQNWFPQILPPSVATVFIEQDPNVVVTFQGTAGSTSVANIVLNGALDIDADDNDVLTISGDVQANGVLKLRRGVLNVQGNLDVDGTFSLWGGQLRDARLTSTSGPIVVPGNVAPTLNNVTVATEIHIAHNARVSVTNGLQMEAGRIHLLHSNNSATYFLHFLGSQSIAGSGEIIFDGQGSSFNPTVGGIYVATPDTTLTVENGITIRSGIGSGMIIANASSSIVFRGTLIANVPDRPIVISANPVIFDGQVRVEDGGSLRVYGNWINLENGSISAVNSFLRLHGNWLNEGTILSANSEVEFGGASTDTWQNTGVIDLTNSPVRLGGEFSYHLFDQFQTQSPITLSGVLNNQGNILNIDSLAPGGFFIGSDGRLVGGVIDGVLPLSFVPLSYGGTLDGVTMRTDVIINNANAHIENGLTLENSDIILQSEENESAFVWFVGTQSLSGTGNVIFDCFQSGSGSNDCAILATERDSVLTVEQGVTVSSGTTAGRILADLNANSRIDIYGDIYTDQPNFRFEAGNGSVIGGNIFIGNGASFEFQDRWTATKNSTITATNAALTLGDNWTNYGQIVADNSPLRIGFSPQSTWSNQGTLDCVDSVTILDGTFRIEDLGDFTTNSLVELSGTLLNDAQVFNYDTTFSSGFRMGDYGKIVGGTVDGASDLIINEDVEFVTLDNVTLNVNVELYEDSSLSIENDLYLNNANIVFRNGLRPATLYLSSSSNIAGTGEIQFAADSGSNYRGRIQFYQYPLQSVIPVIGENITFRTISSSGNVTSDAEYRIQGRVLSEVENEQIDFTNAIIEGDVSIKNGATVHLFKPHITSTGTVIADSGAIVVIFRTGWVNDGIIRAQDGASLSLRNSWQNNGLIEVHNNSTLELSGSWQNNGTIQSTDSLFQMGGSFDLNAIGSVSSNTDIAITGELINNGTLLDTDAFGSATLTLGHNGKITGGGVVGVSGLRAQGSSTLNGVTLATDLSLTSGAKVKIENDLMLLFADIILAANGAFTELYATRDQLITGFGDIIFAGIQTAPIYNRFRVDGLNTVVTFDEGISLRTDTGNGVVGTSSTQGRVVLNGALVNTQPQRIIEINAGSFELNGSITVGESSSVHVGSMAPVLSSSASLDIDLGTVSNGVINFAHAPTFSGTLNLALQGGLMPAACEAFVFANYPSALGGFSEINGPDFGNGATFFVEMLPAFAQAVVPGDQCTL